MMKESKTHEELAEMIERRLAEPGVKISVEHVGDGNWKAEILQHPDQPKYFAHRFKAIVADLQASFCCNDADG